MHLTSVSIENIRSIRSLRWSVPEGRGAGWHVILGENGAGKTTFLRAVALALLGDKQAGRLRPSWTDWLRRDAQSGEIKASLLRHGAFDPVDDMPEGEPTFGLQLFVQEHSARLYGEDWAPTRCDLWESRSGWLSAAYGAFRRLSGGDPEYERQFSEYERLVRHLSLFDERVSLVEGVEWMKKLDHERLEEIARPASNGSSSHKGESSLLLERVERLINQPGFLPHGTRLKDVTSRGVRFVDGGGEEVFIQEMSDGYRSILSLTLDLLRRFAQAYGAAGIFDNDGVRIEPPGVVLIDEIDAHLHPTWQHAIGLWFKRYFPNVQFLVATHSPIVCQAADSVFFLPSPGSGRSGKMLEGVELDRLRYGNVLDAYSTGVFGFNVTRSEESMERLRRLSELDEKELGGEGLSAEEKQEQLRWRSAMPTLDMDRPPGQDP